MNDGIIEDDEGEPMKEIPGTFHWASSLWISQHGTLKRRYFDVFSNKWIWGSPCKLYINDLNGVLYYNINNNRIPLRKLMAIAWIEKKKPYVNLKDVKIKNINDEYTLENMFWSDNSSYTSISLESDTNEMWKPLECNIGVLQMKTEISNKGRIRNQEKNIVNSFYYKDVRVVPIHNCTLMPINCKKTHIPLYIKNTINILKKYNIKYHAKKFHLKKNTAWSYAYIACIQLDVDAVTEICKKNISHSAWNGMQTIFKQNIEDCLSFPLRNVIHLFDHILCDDPDWRCNANRFSEIRLLKLLFQKIYIDEETKSDIIICD
tara:strand:- start:1486 stop:2442 length:957 start_codon:yes stop_codon:yes gene_type:complete